MATKVPSDGRDAFHRVPHTRLGEGLHAFMWPAQIGHGRVRSREGNASRIAQSPFAKAGNTKPPWMPQSSGIWTEMSVLCEALTSRRGVGVDKAQM